MTPSKFERDTAVTRVDAGVFTAVVDPGWHIVRGPNGGYLAAIMMRAFAATVDDPARAARSLSVHFTAPPAEGSVRVETTVERAGRSLTTVTGRLWQGERMCAAAIAAYSAPRTAPEFQDAAMPIVPPPEQAAPLSSAMPISVPIRDRYDQRMVQELEGSADGQAVTGGWTRLSDPSVADAPLIAAFCDGWPPAIRHRLAADGGGLRGGVPTVDLTVHFRQALPLPAAQPDDFYLAVFRTRMAKEGFLEEDGEIWGRDGTLLAHSRQLGVLL